ncbi:MULTISPECIES: alpha/beta fold hydrolase [unclassified Anaeromyxobacter]|uniref:alpha/beta fold hydrolase n=1 Tax=unclassified Anaeromyxobacter TaxID=2620896 RepID=UPI001F57EA6D|nr:MULTISPECIES: alpha/beta fold hydrolase [unclassified Anaeromyxobacter]
MPLVTIPGSPVAPGRAPLRVNVRERGRGPAALLLHGGWGHEAYPFDAAAEALAPRHRVIVPDRIGYGASEPLAELPRRFHQAMADETVALLDALGIERAALWGHSDGAVVAAWAAIRHPARVTALVLEALHFFRAKPSSLEFFRTGLEAPERYGEGVVRALERDHGARWREVVARGARAWLDILAEGERAGGDLYDGRLGEITARTLVLHGRRDPRLEPGELEAALRALPRASLAVVDAGHSPHTSSAAGPEAVRRAAEFLALP